MGSSSFKTLASTLIYLHRLTLKEPFPMDLNCFGWRHFSRLWHAEWHGPTVEDVPLVLLRYKQLPAHIFQKSTCFHPAAPSIIARFLLPSKLFPLSFHFSFIISIALALSFEFIISFSLFWHLWLDPLFQPLPFRFEPLPVVLPFLPFPLGFLLHGRYLRWYSFMVLLTVIYTLGPFIHLDILIPRNFPYLMVFDILCDVDKLSLWICPIPLATKNMQNFRAFLPSRSSGPALR